MKKRYNGKKFLYLALSLVLLAAMALSVVGCGKKEAPKGGTASFQVVVTDLEGTETTFDFTSDKAMVGEVLVDEGLIEGEQGPYGMYIKSVNGVTLDWDRDQKYWSFYVNGEYATAGVDQTEITDGAVYSLKPEG